MATLLLTPQEPPLDEIIGRLGDESPEARDQAARTIVERGEKALEPLRKALLTPDPEVRGRIQGLILRLEWEPIVPSNLLARASEAREALQRGDHAGFIEAVRDRSGWEFGGQEELEAYAIRLLGHPDLQLSRQSIEILSATAQREGAIPRRPVSELVHLLSRWSPKAWDDPEERCLDELAFLLHRVASPRDLAVLSGARADHPSAGRRLGLLRAGLGDESTVPLLIETLRGPGSLLQSLAVQSAAKGRCSRAGEAVAKLLETNQAWEAWGALEVLLKPSFAGSVIDAARRIPPDQRTPVQFRLLATLGTEEAVALILESLPCDGSGEWAASTLLQSRCLSSFDNLCAAARGAGKSACSCAIAAAVLADGRTVDRYLELLDDPSPRTRHFAFMSLRYVENPEARRKMLPRLEKGIPADFRDAVVDGVASWESDSGPFLERIARSPGDPLARKALEALLGLRGADALPLLGELHAKGVPIPLGSMDFFFARGDAKSLFAVAEGASDVEVQYFILPRLEVLGAKDEIARLLSRAPIRGTVAMSLLRTGGDGLKALKEAADEVSWGEADDLAERGAPGVRELLRERMKAALPDAGMLQALRNWAHPEMVPALRKALARYDAGRPPGIGDPQAPEFCSMVLAGRNWGHDTLSALGATGDRSLLPLLLERLRDPEPGMQAVAIRALAKWRAREAVPALRQIVLSDRPWIRARALRGLAEIGAPGTEEFIRAHLRDNPHAGPSALARMGVDAREEVGALLEDRVAPGPVLGALDLMAHPAAYAKIDAALPRRAPNSFVVVRRIVERLAGLPCRITPAVLARGAHGGSEAETLRELFEGLETWDGVTHVLREGAIELCTLDEARRFWSK